MTEQDIHSAQRPAGLGLPLAVLTALATVLRMMHLYDQPLWYDEVAALYRASAESLSVLLRRLAADVQLPLYDLLHWPLVRIFGPSDELSRLPALLASVALVPAVAQLVMRLGGQRRAALLAAAWMAINPYLLRYGVEGRPYALLALLTVLALSAALQLVSRGGRSGAGLSLWLTALVLLQPYGLVAALAVVAWLLGNGAALRGRLSALLWVLAAPALALAALVPLVVHQLASHSMSDIYSGLDAEALSQVIDGWGPLAPQAVAGQLMWAVWACRLALPLLAVLGLLRLRGHQREPAQAQPAVSPTPSARGAARVCFVLALLLMVGLLLLGQGRLAALASGAIKGGLPLDEGHLATLSRLRLLGFAAFGLLLLLSWTLSRSARWAQHWGGRLSPALALLMVGSAPLLAALVLDLLGKPTFAPRNAMGSAPLVACAVALGLSSLTLPLRWTLCSALLAGAMAGERALPDFHRRLPWPDLVAALRESGATPITHPPFIARCVEYHAGLPWESVWGARRPAAFEEHLSQRPLGRVALVTAFHGLADAEQVSLACTRVATPGEIVHLRGLKLELYAPR